MRQRAKSSEPVRKTASTILKEEAAVDEGEVFDVFLSHSSAEEKELILGVKRILEDHGLTVYVDQIDDPQLSPAHVSRETAEVLRRRMRASSSLLFLHSTNSAVSKWMPWELGFFDGYSGKVGVFPVTKSEQETYQGQEYLALYPYVDSSDGEDGDNYLWIVESADCYAQLDGWIAGDEEIEEHQ